MKKLLGAINEVNSASAIGDAPFNSGIQSCDIFSIADNRRIARVITILSKIYQEVIYMGMFGFARNKANGGNDN